jgi:hypothetical protein
MRLASTVPIVTFKELPETFREQSETFGELSGNIQGTFRALAANTLSEHFQGTFRALLGHLQRNIHGMFRPFREQSETFREYSETFRVVPEL